MTRTEFLVRIVYKSGYVYEDWFRTFSISPSKAEWVLVDPDKKILQLGFDEIAAVFQIKTRRGFEVKD